MAGPALYRAVRLDCSRVRTAAGKTAALILSLFLSFLSFPNMFFSLGFGPAAWVCAGFLFCALQGEPWPRRLGLGLAYGVVFYAGLVSWMAAYNRAGYLVFVVLLCLQPLIFALFFPLPFSRKPWALLYWPALWVSSEYLRKLVMQGFSWDLGHSQCFTLPVLQWVSVAGSSGVSFFLVLFNTAVYLFLTDKRRRRLYAVSLCLALLVIWGGGSWMLGQVDPADSRESRQDMFRLAVVQPNADPRDKLDPDKVDALAEGLVRLTGNIPRDFPPDLVLWPETAVPSDVRQQPGLLDKITALTLRIHSPLLTGMAVEENGNLYNAAVLITSSSAVTVVYRKRILVPFSEYYFPGRAGGLLQRFSGGEEVGFSPGHAPGLVPLSLLRPGTQGFFGVVICSEDTMAALFRTYAAAGARGVIVLLNDGWFRDPRALVLHAGNAVMRAVENRRPVVRVGNSGWTCLIDAGGRVQTFSLEPQTRGYAVFDLYPSLRKAVYTDIGDSFCLCVLGFVIIVQLRRFFRVIRRRRYDR